MVLKLLMDELMSHHWPTLYSSVLLSMVELMCYLHVFQRFYASAFVQLFAQWSPGLIFYFKWYVLTWSADVLLLQTMSSKNSGQINLKNTWKQTKIWKIPESKWKLKEQMLTWWGWLNVTNRGWLDCIFGKADLPWMFWGWFTTFVGDGK